MHKIYKTVREDYILMIENYFDIMAKCSPEAYQIHKASLIKTYKKLNILNVKIARGLQ